MHQSVLLFVWPARDDCNIYSWILIQRQRFGGLLAPLVIRYGDINNSCLETSSRHIFFCEWGKISFYLLSHASLKRKKGKPPFPTHGNALSPAHSATRSIFFFCFCCSIVRSTTAIISSSDWLFFLLLCLLSKSSISLTLLFFLLPWMGEKEGRAGSREKGEKRKVTFLRMRKRVFSSSFSSLPLPSCVYQSDQTEERGKRI